MAIIHVRDNARNNARSTQARKAMHGLVDNIKTWTGLSMEESIRMTEDRDKRRKYVHSVALGSRMAKIRSDTGQPALAGTSI